MPPHFTTIFCVNHGTTSATGNFVNKMVAREDKLEKSMVRDARYGRKFSGLVLSWYQIFWTYWVQNQWASVVPVVVSTFEALWDWMDLNYLW